MKVERQSENCFVLSKDKDCFQLCISIEEEKKLNFFVKDITTPFQSNDYSIFFTIGSLIDIDQRFRAFFCVKEIYQEILIAFEKCNLEIERENENLILIFGIIGSSIKIPLSPQKDTDVLIPPEQVHYEKTNSSVQNLLPNEGTFLAFKELINNSEKNVNENVKNLFDSFKKELKDIINNHTNSTDLFTDNFNEFDFLKESKKQKIRPPNSFSLLNMKLKKALTDHTNWVSSICLTEDGKLASCSLDETIKIFNIQTCQCEYTLTGHTHWVNDISSLNNGLLISGSDDKTIKIWKKNSLDYLCIKTLRGHFNGVSKVIQLSKSRIGSCSDDKTIKIWSSSNYKCLRTLIGHTDWIRSIIELKNKKYIVSGGEESLRFWNNLSYECEEIINDINCLGTDSLVEGSDNQIIIGGNSEITIVNANSFKVEKQIGGVSINRVFSLLPLSEDYVLCGCENKEGKGFLVNFNTSNYKVSKIKDEVHEGSIFGMLLSPEDVLITCSKDKLIKIWEY